MWDKSEQLQTQIPVQIFETIKNFENVGIRMFTNHFVSSVGQNIH